MLPKDMWLPLTADAGTRAGGVTCCGYLWWQSGRQRRETTKFGGSTCGLALPILWPKALLVMVMVHFVAAFRWARESAHPICASKHCKPFLGRIWRQASAICEVLTRIALTPGLERPCVLGALMSVHRDESNARLRYFLQLGSERSHGGWKELSAECIRASAPPL